MKNSFSLWSDNDLEVIMYDQKTKLDLPVFYPSLLYHTAKHINTQTADNYFSFYLFKVQSSRPIALIHFSQSDAFTFISPCRAPFGGLQCNENCTSGELQFLLKCVEIKARELDLNQIIIKTAPSCYQPKIQQLLLKVYEFSGYNVLLRHKNLHLSVSQVPFRQMITKSKQKRLFKCKSSGFKANASKKLDIFTIYQFIKESYNSKGYEMSMSFYQLNLLFSQFPEEVLLFIVTDLYEDIIAMTITIRVSEKVLYNFMPADLIAYKRFSPMVLLNEALYNYCQQEKIMILDQGISLDRTGQEKPGLIRFKENLGGQESIKLTYQKMLL